MHLRIHTFKTNESVEDLNEFERFREMFLQENLPGMAELYAKDQYRISDLMAISIAYVDDIPYACSSLFRRDAFPEFSARCVNRFFVLKDFRFGGKNYKQLKSLSLGNPRSPVVSVQMAAQQIKVAHELGMHFCFVTREIPNRNWCLAMADALNRETNYKWSVSNEAVCVHDPIVFSCWQHVVWTDLTESNKNFEFTVKSSEREILNRFRVNP